MKKVFAYFATFAAFSFACLPSLAEMKGSYKLTPLDVLNIKVFQEPDLDTVYKINADGNIVMPLIGAVKVGGLTVSDAQLKIKELYEKDYLVNANITIFVTEYAPRRVYVIGQVLRPGEVLFPVEQELTLSRAIANAGGPSRIAKTRAINVKRKLADGTIRVFEVDLDAILNDKSATDFPLRDNDTIEVKESAF